MKGIPRLKPIDEPVEGMPVIWTSTLKFLNPALYIKTINGDKIGVAGSMDSLSAVEADISELFQIVIEYCDILPEWIERGDNLKERYKKTLPLHPLDWKVALPLIGKEVEFEIGKYLVLEAGMGIDMAKLILPKQEETWDDIFKRYDEETPMSTIYHEWLKQNYSPPKRIKQ